jgi:NADPH:quinone reductase-like Zn-dependent oxidoreductase
MATMKAVYIHAYGGSEVLSYEEGPQPTMGQDEVLIRVVATSVNPFDWTARYGYLSDYYSYAFPHILGLDVAGVIEDVGAQVQGLSVGDEVFARSHPSRNGAYAEYIALPSAMVALKPRTMDFYQSAAVPHAAVAAWIALFDTAGLSGGQTVLIHGAAGGVGSFAVQLAKYRGAIVIGTSSASNSDYLRSLGCDEVIDYTAIRFENTVHDVDVVLDLIGDMGDNTQMRSWPVLKTGGTLVSLVQFPSTETAAVHAVRSFFVTAERCDADLLNKIAALIDGGQICPVAMTVLSLDEIKQAHELSQSRHTRGKIVLRVND